MEKTKPSLRNLVIYQVYVRDYSEAGTFKALSEDLDRIAALGVDFVYLLPIHPIGEANRKGTLGCPYSIRDYRAINPELGTIDDFRRLVDAVHEHKLKLMIDIVFNHTARDSRLLKEHPEWFHTNEKGEYVSRVADWWDVCDFDYTKDKALWEELSNTLAVYADIGVDGFRMDVASLVPLDFWNAARKTISKDYRDIIWLSESVHGPFCKYMRDRGFECASEGEIFQVFDLAYDYDVYPYLEAHLSGKGTLRAYLESLARQDEIYPKNYVKLKYLENHDTMRIAERLHGDLDKIYNWMGFLFFQKGATMLYNGQEFVARKKLSLFEKETIDRHKDISGFIRKLTSIKKRRAFAEGIYQIHFPEIDGVAHITYEDDKTLFVGLFNLALAEGEVNTGLKDGTYRNYLNGKTLKVRKGLVRLTKEPLILHIAK